MPAALTIIVVLLTIVLFHELGHFIVAKASGVRVEEFGIGFPPRLLSIKRGETVYSLNVLLVGAFVRMGGEEAVTADSRSFQGKSPATRILIGAAGPVANVLLAFVLFTASFILPYDVVTGGEGIKIARVAAGSPAQIAGIEEGDVVLAIKGQPVSIFEELRQAVQTYLDQEVPLLIRRGGQEVELKIVPRSNPPSGEGAMGVALTWEKLHVEKKSNSFSEAIVMAAGMFTSLPGMIGEMAGSVSDNVGQSLIGPIGAAQITGEVTKFGISPLLGLVASLSLGLALFNIIPLPPLDGGGILISAVEAMFKGKRLAPKWRRIIYGVGTTLLLTLIVAITYNDILRLMNGRSVLP